jgi:uncharacterized membrane protein
MWPRASVFALLYALPEFLRFFIWTGLEGIGYSALVGAVCAIAMARLTGNVRIATIAACGAFYALPLYLVIPNWGLGINFSGVFALRLVWFAIVTFCAGLFSSTLRERIAGTAR